MWILRIPAQVCQACTVSASHGRLPSLILLWVSVEVQLRSETQILMARRWHHDILLSLLESECREQATHLNHLWFRGTTRVRTHKIISFLNYIVSDKEIYNILFEHILHDPLCTSLCVPSPLPMSPLDSPRCCHSHAGSHIALFQGQMSCDIKPHWVIHPHWQGERKGHQIWGG